jgi:hypothetical protein
MPSKQAIRMGDYRFDLTDEISYDTIALQKDDSIQPAAK